MTLRTIADYIGVYDDVLPVEYCASLIDRFENNSEQYELVTGEANDGRSRRFTMLNVEQNWADVNMAVWKAFQERIAVYRNTLGIKKFWPQRLKTEALRMKRYTPGGVDRYDAHVDVLDLTDSGRLLTMLVYLNEPNGGETVFPDFDIKVSPKPGRLLIFPPVWLFVHAGLPVHDRPKYIMQGYLRYPPRDPAANIQEA